VTKQRLVRPTQTTAKPITSRPSKGPRLQPSDPKYDASQPRSRARCRPLTERERRR